MFKARRQLTGRRAMRGSGEVVFLAGLLVLIAAGAGAWLLLGGRSESSSDVVSIDAGSDGAQAAPPGMVSLAEIEALEANGPRNVGGIETRPAGGYETYERVYGGAGGTITGDIKVEGASFPETWTIHLEPSIMSTGRDEAIKRSVASEPGMRSFEIRDLPLAAYRIRAEAPGLSSRSTEVMMFQVKGQEHLPGLNQINVDLTLRPMATLSGVIRKASGDMASDLDVYLVPRELAQSDGMGISASVGDAPAAAAADENEVKLVRKTVQTNPSGSFRFDLVEPGPWMIFVGDPVKPLLPPIPVGVQSADQALDEIQLPVLGALEVIVIDHLARPCPNVDLVGYLRGSGSGSLRGTTDGVGRVMFPYLAPGAWRIEADDKLMKQTGQLDFRLEAGEEPVLQEIHIQ